MTGAVAKQKGNLTSFPKKNCCSPLDNMRKMRKIDIHANATAFLEYVPNFKHNGQRFVSAEELIEMYDVLGIKMGVLQTLVSPEAMPSPMTSESCKMLVDKYPTRFGWFCGIDPRAINNTESCDFLDLLNHYKSMGAKGVGEINANMYIDSPMIDNLFSYCEASQMPVMIHLNNKIGGGYGLVDEPGLPRLERMLQKHPNLRVIGHSVPFWNEITEENGRRLEKLMENYENLYCDLSAGSGSSAMMRDGEYAALFLTKFQNRIYYGCDIVTGTETYLVSFQEFLEKLCEEGKITQRVYEKICRENAEKLFGLE